MGLCMLHLSVVPELTWPGSACSLVCQASSCLRICLFCSSPFQCHGIVLVLFASFCNGTFNGTILVVLVVVAVLAGLHGGGAWRG